ncbi:hypothetical protein [Streptomyces sp. NPDC091217]|uniref:hypothetical protein n=1 Tax=Streptomyces sp. NPDC091217 TaxID=3365975 RepID=UPI00382D1400
MAVGPDLETAVVTAVLLEQACKQRPLTHGLVGRPMRTDQEEALTKHGHVCSETSLRQVRDDLVRALRG